MTLLAQIANPEGMTYGWLFVKMIVALIFVIVAALLTLKFVLPRLVKVRKTSGSSIDILEHQPLDPKRSVYLVRIKDKEVAFAMTEHGVGKLAEWEMNKN